MNVRKKLLYVGHNAFPLGMAQVERQKLIAQGLMACGCEVTILNRYGIRERNGEAFAGSGGIFEGIPYLVASGTPYRPKTIGRRTYLKFKGLLNEARILAIRRRKNSLDAILITTNSFHNILFYSLLAKILRVPAILDNVEYWSAIPARNSRLKRMEDYLYDHFGYRIVDKLICISDFLVNVVRQGSPKKPVIKIPSIVNYSRFSRKRNAGTDFFLFCGSAIYFEVIHFVVEAFEKVTPNNHWLYLVCNGEPHDMDQIEKRIAASPRQQQIRLLTALSYKNLTQLYCDSLALLIPLRNSTQDRARFPHKIGEYCASGRPFISTNFGEVRAYFSDRLNAWLADEYEVGAFSAKMQEAILHPQEADEIGRQACQLGLQNFDHLALGRKIYDFIFNPEK